MAQTFLGPNESALERSGDDERDGNRFSLGHRGGARWSLARKLDGEGETMTLYSTKGRTEASRLSQLSACVVILICLFFTPSTSRAHIGSPNVFFEGQAGPYPVRIVIRPPPVIPGLAEVAVRISTNGVRRVTALPMRWIFSSYRADNSCFSV